MFEKARTVMAQRPVCVVVAVLPLVQPARQSAQRFACKHVATELIAATKSRSSQRVAKTPLSMDFDGGSGHNRGRGGGRGNRGGHRYRVRQPNQIAFQRGMVEDRDPSERERFLKLLFDLGKGPIMKEGTPEHEKAELVDKHTQEHLAGAVHVMRTTAAEDQAMVVDAFLQCVMNMGHRCTYYATLLGMLNYQAPEVAEAVIASMGAQLQLAVRCEGGDEPGHGPDANQKFTLLLRFYAALVPVSAVLCHSLLALLSSIVAAASTAMEQAGPDSDWRCWQPYADFLVASVVLALPWCGAVVSETHLDELQQLTSSIDAYVTGRPCQVARIWMPYSDEDPEDDETGLRDSDSGAASFLARAWAAVQECQEGGWEVHSIPKPYLAMKTFFMGAMEHEVPPLEVPLKPPPLPADATPGEVAAKLIVLYPPRGGMRLISSETSLPSESVELERILAEEYLLHVVHVFAANRDACVVQVASRLHLPFAYDWIVCELLFAQMLRLPHAQLRPYAYQSILLGLTDVTPRIARGFGGCMKAIFQNIGYMDPCLVRRVADLLAYHLSNAFWQWPWARWERVLSAGPLDPQRRFCCTVVGLLIRLSFPEHVKKLLPDGWEELMPAQDGATPPPKADSDDEASGYQAPYDAMLGWIKEKLPAASMVTQLRALAGAEGGDSLAATLRKFAHALLFAAQKTPFHTVTLVDRYKALFTELCAQVDAGGSPGDGEVVLIEAASLAWGCNGLRLSLAVDRFLQESLLQAPAVVKWAFGAGEPRDIRFISDDVHAADAAFDVFHSAVGGAALRVEAPAKGEVASASASESLKETLLLAFRCFFKALDRMERCLDSEQAAAPESEEGAMPEPSERSDDRIRYRMLCSHLMAFNRAYCQHTLPLMPVIESLCLELNVSEDVKRLALLR